jgi:hypothetical protein
MMFTPNVANKMVRQISVSVRATILLSFLVTMGCQDKPAAAPTVANPPTNPTVPSATLDTPDATAQPAATTIAAPRGQLLYQPNFFWSDGEETAQGTGFFVKAPSGKLVAVTSAHFIDADGPALLKAEWQTIDGNELAATLTKSWGPPGKLGRSQFDQRRDYLLFPAEPDIEVPHVFEFDPRPRVEDEELIWFVDKDGSKSAADQRVVSGSVTLESPLALIIELDEPIKLQSQSGSPFISQKTGKVIGILSSATQDGDRVKLIAAPVKKMVEQLQDESLFPELRTVIGKTQPAEENSTPDRLE